MFPLCTSDAEIEDRMEKYILTLKSAGLHGIKKVRYAGDLTSVRLSDEYSVQDYCNTHTTGRNIRETIAIAEILTKKYGRGK